jgi:hypothetical protein
MKCVFVYFSTCTYMRMYAFMILLLAISFSSVTSISGLSFLHTSFQFLIFTLKSTYFRCLVSHSWVLLFNLFFFTFKQCLYFFFSLILTYFFSFCSFSCFSFLHTFFCSFSCLSFSHASCQFPVSRSYILLFNFLFLTLKNTTLQSLVFHS